MQCTCYPNVDIHSICKVYIYCILQEYASYIKIRVLYHNSNFPGPCTCHEPFLLDWAAALALFTPVSLKGNSWSVSCSWSNRYCVVGHMVAVDTSSPSISKKSGISKSASSCTSGTLSSKPWEGSAGEQWVPWNPENKRSRCICQFSVVYTSICRL